MPNLNDETTDKRMKETESIIYSMTLEERRDPSIITLSRKQRIAKGCGKDLAAINRLLKQFEQSKQMMKQIWEYIDCNYMENKTAAVTWN